jgi:hypothetical protein
MAANQLLGFALDLATGNLLAKVDGITFGCNPHIRIADNLLIYYPVADGRMVIKGFTGLYALDMRAP